MRSSLSLLQTSSIDRSHHDPVYDVFWIQSKTNNQFVSVSTDGQMMWWDSRRLVEPTEVLQLNDGSGRVLGGSSLEYNVEAGPAKYLVGTEQGARACICEGPRACYIWRMPSRSPPHPRRCGPVPQHAQARRQGRL